MESRFMQTMPQSRWMTDDSANLSPGGGGLRIYTLSANESHSFEEINAQAPVAMRENLRAAGAEIIDVPYKQNRMVMFDSSLYHETQPFQFSTKRYDEKRINFTLLYGALQCPPTHTH
jgi:hypothetical protein